MAVKLENENIDNLDEAELRDWASDAIDELKERQSRIDGLLVSANLVEALSDVFAKYRHGTAQLLAAAHEFVSAA